MSVSGSLSNALSGLTAAARAAQVVSANISNALTDGYGRRELQLSARSLAGAGGGVRIDGISRIVDQGVIDDRRLAAGAFENTSTLLNFLKLIEASIGSPELSQSLNGRIVAFESSLIEAASRPDSEPRLQSVLSAATDLAQHLGAISDEVQNLRMRADQAIATEVVSLNSDLQKVADLNTEIRLQRGAGRDASALMDQRQQIVDRISETIPVKAVDRDFDQIALFTPGGSILLDGKPAVLGFSQVGVIVPQMTLASGALSGLTVNGVAVSTDADPGPIAGGLLAAHFEVRDQLAVDAQIRLDAVARDLILRFQDPAVDPTLSAGDAGLFTDNGIAFAVAGEIGLSARLQINAAVDPAQGGEVWRLRAGIGAAAQGEVGNASGLQSLLDALTQKQVPVSGGFMGAARSLSGLSADFLSLIGSARQNAESDHSFTTSRAATLKALELEGGVDSDHELQQLLLVEQAYAANARVIQTVDEMIKTLLGI